MSALQHWHETVSDHIGRVILCDDKVLVRYHQSTPAHARTGFEQAMAEHPGKTVIPRRINDLYLFMVLP